MPDVPILSLCPLLVLRDPNCFAILITESGGLMITFSFPFSPATISTSLPKSWPMVICLNSTFWSWSHGRHPQTFGAEEQRINRQN